MDGIIMEPNHQMQATLYSAPDLRPFLIAIRSLDFR